MGVYKNFKRFVYLCLLPLLPVIKYLNWLVYLKTKEEINLLVGAGTTNFKGWFATDKDTLDITKELDFKKYFKKKKINKVLAEHILEHLTQNDLELMLHNFYKYSSQDINIRIAVPDGFHPDPKYVERVKPGGIGEGAEDHKHLFNYKSLSELFGNFEFIAHPLEYWDENKKFNTKYKNDDKGYILRSFINDDRNKDGLPHYTSLIIDFTKK